MALIKSIDTDFGIPATYWNIGAVQEYVAGADRAALYAIIARKPEFEGAENS